MVPFILLLLILLALETGGSSGRVVCVCEFGRSSGAAKFDAAQLKPPDPIT
jgi:hypothetical protein